MLEEEGEGGGVESVCVWGSGKSPSLSSFVCSLAVSLLSPTCRRGSLSGVSSPLCGGKSLIGRASVCDYLLPGPDWLHEKETHQGPGTEKFV